MPINQTLLDNPKSERVKRVADLARAKGRERSGRFLIEGPQSVREAVGHRPDVVRDLYVAAGDSRGGYASETLERIVDAAQDAERTQGARIYVHRATDEVIARMSGDAQGIVAVGDIEALHAEISGVRLSKRPLVAAFWQVRDPGNAGTVIRAADAAGCDAVVFVDECVDPLNPKVIRSTTGSLFHLPVLRMGVGTFLSWMERSRMETIAADVYGMEDRRPESLPDVLAAYRGADGSGEAVLFGNEARGLPSAVLERMDRIVSIPLYGKAESLNLGTSAAVMLMSMAMARR